MAEIAEAVKQHPHLMVLSDEVGTDLLGALICSVVFLKVYENMVYPGVELTRISSLPGMWERTITVSSAGKTFSVTGWKV